MPAPAAAPVGGADLVGAAQGRAPVSELSERFGLEPDELIADLELAACCGLPPYSPDQLMEIIVDDHEVIADLGTELARPRRLTAAEGFALAASARAIAGGPRRRSRRCAERRARQAGVGARRTRPAAHRPARAGAAGLDPRRRRRTGASSSCATTRPRATASRRASWTPCRCGSSRGEWYLDGFCHTAQGMRRFRIDRVSAARLTGAASPQRDDPAPARRRHRRVVRGLSSPGPEATVAHLAVDDDAAWIIEAMLHFVVGSRCPTGEPGGHLGGGEHGVVRPVAVAPRTARRGARPA